MIRPSYLTEDYKSHTANPIARYLNSLLAAEAKRYKGATQPEASA